MGQVPGSRLTFKRYLVVGGGRVARHLEAYFSLAKIPFLTWNRKNHPSPQLAQEQLLAQLLQASHVLLAVSDSAIETVFEQCSQLLAGVTHASSPPPSPPVFLHLSGFLASPRLASAHPLMTFSSASLYDLETYQSIPFIFENGRSEPSALLPGLLNPTYVLDSNAKPLYHALCSLSGNMTVLLWEKVYREFHSQFQFSKEVLGPYLKQITINLTQSNKDQSVLTGPLARGDQHTLEQHLRALSGDSFEDVYKAFVSAYNRDIIKARNRNGETK